MKKLKDLGLAVLAAFGLIIVTTVVAFMLSHDTNPKKETMHKPHVSPIEKCKQLRNEYNSALNIRYKAIAGNYEDKSHRRVVAYDAYNLSQAPECIDNTIDKSKLEMWVKEYSRFKLERMFNGK